AGAQTPPPPEWATPRPVRSSADHVHSFEVLSNTRWQTLTIGISDPGSRELWITRENLLQNSTLSSLRLGFAGLTYPDLITRVQAWAEPMDGVITWTIETTGVVFYGVQPTHTLFASWATTAYVTYDPPEYLLEFGVIGGPGFQYATGAYVQVPVDVYTITYARVSTANPQLSNPFPVYTSDGAYWPMRAMHPPPGERAWITYTLRIGDRREDPNNPRPDLIWLTPTFHVTGYAQVEISATIRNNGAGGVPNRVGGFLAALYQRPPWDPPSGPLDGRGFLTWTVGPSGVWLPPLSSGHELVVSANAPLPIGDCFFLYVDVDPYMETTTGRVWESNEENNIARICPPTIYLPLVLRGSSSNP
ncbi:MAG TPA: hypothetical protein VNK89_12230, partial [Thermoflexus sp.]|nr:hypothetical protein [Thermoflexus sp.]